MGFDLIEKFSVVERVGPNDGIEIYDTFLLEGEQVLLSYKHARDRVIFTNKKVIAINVQGLTGKKKEFRCFPYSKISSFSVETAGTFDMDSDFKIWVSGVGVFQVKFGTKINIKEVGQLLAEKIC